MEPCKIENTTIADLEFVYSLFDQSIEYQERNGYPAWRGYDKNALIRDASLNVMVIPR